jgi:hypothetical protein
MAQPRIDPPILEEAESAISKIKKIIKHLGKTQ